jgi:signal-transduction protein with cAMP-binding, CBS, and nucleotidyltransferase domain
MRIADLCQRDIVTCDPAQSSDVLAAMMRECHVGDLIVVQQLDGRQTPVGIITDRDLVLKVLAPGLDPASVTASDLMNPVSTITENELVYDAVWAMRRRGCRRLPVTDSQGGLVGLVSVDDLTQFLAEELTELARVSPLQRRLESERLDPRVRGRA